MSNLAHQVQRKTQYTEQVQPKRHVQPQKRSIITKGEKVLWSISAIMLVAASIFVISNYASIYSINKDVQVTKSKIEQQQKEVSDLSLQVSELSTPQRIKEYAREKLGMTFNDQNVKVINN
ncbi:cell division protein FtsL [Alkalihalobacillus sp. AL-G]|uniref:cell division protein FtsL n=1 Tax=Alkalihalobacillus sp. AL-G TaxID=2926399 RepID=UPI00272B187A|nr:cell division protein FtsL [Alkalihalobacillus sp. AL-G]WLD95060.1 cell division protein FtsL [Alkalihalobacillus sp. AL-G]